MGPDLDLLEEFLLETTAKTVRVGSKFQPKVRPKKASSVLKSSVQSFDKAEKVVSDPMVTNELSASPVHALEDYRSVDCVNKSMDHAVAGETVDVNASLNDSEFFNVSEGSPLDNRKSTGVNVDAYFGLESLEDSCSQPTTAVDTDVKDSEEPSRTTLPGNQKLSELDEPQDYFGADFECAAKDSFSDRIESASHMQGPPSAVSSDEFILDEFSFAFPENNAEFQPYTSLDSTSELPGNNESLNEEPTPPVEISQENISFSAMDALASKVSTEGDERIESEEADNNDDGRVSGKRKKKPPAKSKRSVCQKGKSVSQNGKSVSKRKRGNESPDEPTEKIPKRLPRPKRKVNKALLETPEEELDLQQISIRDLILLAEHREKLEKNAKAEESHSTNPSASNSIPRHMRDETASEQANEETDPPVQDGCVHTNYHSYMERTPRVRWSKQDTELFYQAVRQFGSDLSFIQQLFPGRTRTQIKLKYKKEERQNPVMLHDALTGRAKDNSHFEQLIKLLKKDQDDSADLASNEDLCGPEITGGEMEKTEQVTEKTEQVVEKAEQEEEVEKVEPTNKEDEVENATEQAVSEVRSSPVKHYESEDDDGIDWGIYNSEI